jgi:hypothetical protein
MKYEQFSRLIGLGLVMLCVACGSDSTGDGDAGPAPGDVADDPGAPVDVTLVDEGTAQDEGVSNDTGSATDTSVVADIPVVEDVSTSVDTGTGEDTAAPVDVPVVEDVPVVVDEGTPDQGPPLPELFLGQPIDIAGTENMQSLSSWLYGMAVDHEHRVSLMWGGTPQGSGDMKLYISQSNVTVEAFAAPIVIDESIPADADDRKGDIDTVGDEHLILWKDGDSDGSKIRFRRTAQADFTGPTVTVFSDNPGVLNYRPYMLRSPDAQNIWVFWQREQSVVVVKSTDGGLSFSGPVPTVVQPSSLEAFTSAAAITPSGRIIVCYHGHPIGVGLGQNSIYCQNSDDGAESFDDPVEVSALSGFDGNHGHPSMALGQDNRVHVVWTFNNGDNALKTSSTDGVEWADITPLDPLKWMPMVRTGRESLLHLSGFDQMGGVGAPIYLTSPDDGVTLGEPAYLPITPGATVPRHDMVANLTVGYLYICWWEWGGQSKMRVIGIDPYAQTN